MVSAVDSLVGLVPVVVASHVVLSVSERAFQQRALEGNSPGKKSKSSAGYVSRSKTSGERCGNCSLYRENNNTCKIVKGSISSKGHSKFWTDD